MKHTLYVLRRNTVRAVVVLGLVTSMATGIQAQDPPEVQTEQESKWKKAGEEIKEAAGAVGEASQDSFEKAREESASAWDKTKNGSAELWDKTKEGTEKVWEKTKEESRELWDATKETTVEGYDTVKEKVHEMTAPEPEDAPKEPHTPPALAE